MESLVGQHLRLETARRGDGNGTGAIREPRPLNRDSSRPREDLGAKTGPGRRLLDDRHSLTVPQVAEQGSLRQRVQQRWANDFDDDVFSLRAPRHRSTTGSIPPYATSVRSGCRCRCTSVGKRCRAGIDPQSAATS